MRNLIATEASDLKGGSDVPHNRGKQCPSGGRWGKYLLRVSGIPVGTGSDDRIFLSIPFRETQTANVGFAFFFPSRPLPSAMPSFFWDLVLLEKLHPQRRLCSAFPTLSIVNDGEQA